jgi:hypothetical protein
LFCIVKALGGGDDALVQSSRLAEEETMREGSTTARSRLSLDAVVFDGSEEAVDALLRQGSRRRR